MNKTYFILLLTIVIASKLTAHNNKELAHPFEYNDGFETAVATLSVHDKVTNDTTPTLTGTGGANAILTVNVDTNADGTAEVTYTTTADANGDWSVDTDNAKPDSGTFTALSDNAVISVLVTDAGNGATGTVRIDTTPPTVDMKATKDTTPTLTGSAEIGEVLTVEIDTNNDGTIDITYTATADANAKWRVDTGAVLPSNGVFTPLNDDAVIDIIVKDVAANSATGTVRIDITAPTVDKKVTKDTTPALTGRAEANEALTVDVDTNNDGTTDLTYTTTAATNGEWRVDTGAATPSSGTFTALNDDDVIGVDVTDEAGNSGSKSVRIDTSKPDVLNDRSNNPTPTISGTAEPNEELTIEVDIGQNYKVDVIYTVTADAKGDWRVDTSTAMPTSGRFTAAAHGVVLVIYGRDKAGNQGEATIVIDLLAPTVNTNPAPKTRPVLSGTAQTNELLTVLVEYDSNKMGHEAVVNLRADANGNWRVDTAMAPSGGTFKTFSDNDVLTISVTDQAGNSSTGTVSIDTTPPTVGSEFGPATRATLPIIKGRREGIDDLLTVELDVNGNGRVVTYAITKDHRADGLTYWEIRTATDTPTSGGPFTPLRDDDVVFVTATDAAGNTATGTVRIDTIRPTLSTKTTSDPTPILKGRGEANELIYVDITYQSRGRTKRLYRTTADANGDWSLDTATAIPYSGGPFLPFNHNEDLVIFISDSVREGAVITTYPKIDLVAPTVDTKTTNDITPTLTGKAEANEVLTVDVDTDNNGTTDLSYTITVANDAWSIDTGAVAPNNGVLFPTLRDKDIIGVTVTDAASNSGSGTVRIDTSALSVEDLEQKNRVYVYPNPVFETLNFSFGSKTPYHATVYDLSGKKRLSAELPQLSLDVSSLDKGVYFVVVEHTSGEKQTLKFIKENKP